MSSGYVLMKQEAGVSYSIYGNGCQTGSRPRVQVIVIDSAGAQASATASLTCYKYLP
ncbi:MAG TPA: hypothetical protein VFZ66_23040 [Herpetosiphonaceae bacterium]